MTFRYVNRQHMINMSEITSTREERLRGLWMKQEKFYTPTSIFIYLLMKQRRQNIYGVLT